MKQRLDATHTARAFPPVGSVAGYIDLIWNFKERRKEKKTENNVASLIFYVYLVAPALILF
jgi:hypothetical protein